MTASGSTTSATTTGGVATAKGFRAAGISAGIKATKKLDLALVVSETPATAAAMFTQNKVQAAPVLVCKDHLQKSGGVGSRDRREQRLRKRMHGRPRDG